MTMCVYCERSWQQAFSFQVTLLPFLLVCVSVMSREAIILEAHNQLFVSMLYYTHVSCVFLYCVEYFFA